MSGFKLEFVGKPITYITKEEVQKAAHALFNGTASIEEQKLMGSIFRSHIVTPDVQEESYGDLFDSVNYPCCLSMPVSTGGNDLHIVSEVLSELKHCASEYGSTLEFQCSDKLREMVKFKEERTIREENKRPLSAYEQQLALSSKHIGVEIDKPKEGDSQQGELSLDVCVPFLHHTSGPRVQMASSNLREAEAIENARHEDNDYSWFKAALSDMRDFEDNPRITYSSITKTNAIFRSYLEKNLWTIDGEVNEEFISMLQEQDGLENIDMETNHDPNTYVAELHFKGLEVVVIHGKKGSC